MSTIAKLALSLFLAIGAPAVPATAADPTTLAPVPQAAEKYVVHVDGMT